MLALLAPPRPTASLGAITSTDDLGIAATVHKMVAYANEDCTDPLIRAQAGAAIRACAREDYACQAVSLMAWVQSRVQYVEDPANRELVQRPREIAAQIDQGQRPLGDCDDHATYLAALTMSVGMPTSFRVIGRGNNLRHVYVLAHGFHLDSTQEIGTDMSRAPVRRAWEISLDDGVIKAARLGRSRRDRARRTLGDPLPVTSWVDTYQDPYRGTFGIDPRTGYLVLIQCGDDGICTYPDYTVQKIPTLTAPGANVKIASAPDGGYGFGSADVKFLFGTYWYKPDPSLIYWVPTVAQHNDAQGSTDLYVNGTALFEYPLALPPFIESNVTDLLQCGADRGCWISRDSYTRGWQGWSDLLFRIGAEGGWPPPRVPLGADGTPALLFPSYFQQVLAYYNAEYKPPGVAVIPPFDQRQSAYLQFTADSKEAFRRTFYYYHVLHPDKSFAASFGDFLETAFAVAGTAAAAIAAAAALQPEISAGLVAAGAPTTVTATGAVVASTSTAVTSSVITAAGVSAGTQEVTKGTVDPLQVALAAGGAGVLATVTAPEIAPPSDVPVPSIPMVDAEAPPEIAPPSDMIEAPPLSPPAPTLPPELTKAATGLTLATVQKAVTGLLAPPAPPTARPVTAPRWLPPPVTYDPVTLQAIPTPPPPAASDQVFFLASGTVLVVGLIKLLRAI